MKNPSGNGAETGKRDGEGERRNSAWRGETGWGEGAIVEHSAPNTAVTMS